MDEVKRPHDIDQEALLGARWRDEGAHEGLREVLAQITAISTKPPDEEVEDAHLRRMIELARGASAPGLARALAEVTAFSTKQPSSAVTTAHLEAMTELAREIAGDPGTRRSPIAIATKPLPRERAAGHRRLALGLVPALAAPLCIVGIAVAGVKLPSAVRAPFDAVGLGLPGQSRSGAVVKEASINGSGCASGIAALREPLRVPGNLCERAGKGERAVEHRNPIAVPRNRPAPRHTHGNRAGIALAAVGRSASAGARAASPARNLAASIGNSPLGQQGPPPAHPAPVAGGGHPGSPPGGGHPRLPPGGGHPGPPPGDGHPGPPPGGGPPATSPVSHPPVGAVYPGKGCGDKNHVHEREGECSKPPK